MRKGRTRRVVMREVIYTTKVPKNKQLTISAIQEHGMKKQIIQEICVKTSAKQMKIQNIWKTQKMCVKITEMIPRVTQSI